MALPPLGSPISLSQVNTELGYPATTLISLNDAAVRTLAGVPSGQISMSCLAGKSAGGITVDGVSYPFAPGDTYNFSSAGIYCVCSTVGTTVITMWGAAGGNQSRYPGAEAGGGGYTCGCVALNGCYTVVVGGGGLGGNYGSFPTAVPGGNPGGGGTGWNPGNNFDGGSGGGYSGIFTDGPIQQFKSVMIAGGGGGGSGDTATGGAGGGATGQSSSNAPGRGGTGGTQGGGGAGNGGGYPGSALQGGAGYSGGAGGGGGYFGGGGGGSSGPGAGGGGSGYFSPVLVTNGATYTGSGPSAANPDGNKPPNVGNGNSGGGAAGQAGYVRFYRP